MKDRTGKTLDIGDKIAYCIHSADMLHIGRVIGFTPKMIRIDKGTTRFPEQVVIIEKMQNAG